MNKITGKFSPLLLVGLGVILAGTVKGQQTVSPDCIVVVNANLNGGSGATVSIPVSPYFDNRTTGCQSWAFTYSVSVTSGSFTSISVQNASGALTAGSFSDWSGTVLSGINPNTNQVGGTATFTTGCIANTACTTPNSWERVLITRNNFVGTIRGVLYGYRSGSLLGGASSGGSPICTLTGTQTTGYVLTATDNSSGCSWQTVGGASVDANTIKNAWYLTDGGSANAITGTTTTTFPGAYATGQAVIFKANATNTGATTININSLGNKNVFKGNAAGPVALAAGNKVSGVTYLAIYDGTEFQLANFTLLAADIPTLAYGTVTSVTCNGGLTGGTFTTSGTCAVDKTLIAQKFFGTAAPGSVAGNLPGDTFSDTTNHNDYWCNAVVGTAAPACTSVTTGGWTLLNGGGGSGITQLTGDAAAGPGSGSQPITFATVNSNVGSCGDSTHVPQVTLNAKGLATACSPVAITAGTGNSASLVTTPFSTTPTFTCPSATAGTVTTFELSTALTANITGSTLASCTTGQILNFKVTQDGTGGRTIVWPTGFSNMCQPNPTLSSTTYIIAFWDGSSAFGQCGTDGISIISEQAAPSGNPPAGYENTWADSTGHFVRALNSSGVFFAMAKELSSGNIRCAGGANAADSACSQVGTGSIMLTPDALDNGGIVWSNASQFKILAHTTTAGLALLSGNAATPAWSVGPPAQKFFGTAAPGSVTGNLPGDTFSDTTNHNDYWCNAVSGTAAPACTSVTTGGWTLLNGGGSTTITVGTTPVASGTSTRILYDNGGTVGEYPISGTGSVCMTVGSSCATGTGGGTVVTVTSSCLINSTCSGANDTGLIIRANISSGTVTLPATPPTAPFILAVCNVNASSLTVARNGNTIYSVAANHTLTQYQCETYASDPTNTNYAGGYAPLAASSSCSAPQVLTAISTSGAGTCSTVPIPQGSHSAAYTTVLADAGTQLLHPTADNNARTFTIDSNANVAYPVGTVLTFYNQINTLTIAITSDTMYLGGTATTGSRTLAAHGIATATKTGTTEWVISGPGLT